MPKTSSSPRRGSTLASLVDKNRKLRFGRYFRDVALAALSASAIGGCSNPWPEANPAFAALECGALVQDLDTPESYGYVGAVVRTPPPPDVAPIDAEWSVEAVASVGERCAGASDLASCEAEVLGGARQRYLVTTEGDEVVRYETDSAVRELLGRIDTPGEAVLLAWFDNRQLVCDDSRRGAVREVEGGYEVVATSVEGGCGSVEVRRRHLLFVSTDGVIREIGAEILSEEDMRNCVIGRRPRGLQMFESVSAGTALGDHLAEMAYLESSAVSEFARLAEELRAYGAPASLVSGARRAMDDEVRHAHDVGALARRFGGAPITAIVDECPRRSLRELAIDNATEGCVRETFGALVGTYQALAAADPEVRALMQQIAQDETFHAELSWAIHRWLMAELPEPHRAEVRAAQRAAVEGLRGEIEQTRASASVDEVVGQPTRTQARGFLDHLTADLWADAASC